MKDESKIFIGSESGFLSLKSNQISMGLNLLGHQESYWDENIIDPRLIGGVPFWMSFKDKSLIPAIPFSQGPAIVIPEKFPVIGRIYRFINSICRWKNNLPYNSGFLSFISNKKSILVFQGFSQSKVEHREKSIFIEGYGPLWEFPVFSPKVIFRYLSVFKTLFGFSFNNKTLINKSEIDIRKKIFLSQDFMSIEEIYDNEKLMGTTLVPFTIRTFSNTRIKYLKNFVCFISLDKGNFIAVSIYEDEVVHKMKELYSSTGKTTIWQFKKKNDKVEKKTILTRIITGGDDFSCLPQ